MTIKQFIILITVSSLSNNAFANTENECLAYTLFYEANTESIEGQRAVYDVVVNRAVASGKTICQVVKQKGQFSWVGKKPIKKYNKEMRELLTIVKSHPRILSDERFMWFFDKKLRPKWAKGMHCRVIGRHRFCKIK